MCQQCGAAYTAWSGRCDRCGEWNSIVEQLRMSKGSDSFGGSTKLEIVKISDTAQFDRPRIATAIKDVDVVLGGGIVAGSINLLAGQPGIGKSTLLLQLVNNIANKVPVLYVSGEESVHQVGMRANRLGVKAEMLDLTNSNSADEVADAIRRGAHQLVVVDSIQTLTCADISSSAGSVSQVTNSAQLITEAAKKNHTAVILVGHVTKEGSIAGPKILEHLVDVVLQIDGDRYGGFKVLRAIKNRYGPTSEAGIFEMEETGLLPVANPSEALLAERQISDGSIVLATMEGSRPLLVEVQALVNKTNYGYPKRAASGIDLNRVNLLIAMLERRTKLELSDKDIYVNIVGGLRVTEPAADLAVCMAIASAAKGMQLAEDAVVFGEIGLSGEVRRVISMDKRYEEAVKLGFSGAIGPVMTRLISGKGNYHPVRNIKDALNQFLSKNKAE